MADQTPDITAILDAGYRLHKAGKLGEAEQHYKQVLAIDPENAEAWQLWGHVAGASKNHHAAAEMMRRSLSHDPDQPEVWLSYAKLLIEIREDDQAVKALEEATRLRPDFAEAHFNLGLAMISAGRPNEAPEHLKSALLAQPVYPEVSRVLASLGAIEPGSGLFKAIEDQLANDDLEASKGAHLHYALAHIYKKEGDKKAFAKNLFEANRLQSQCGPEDNLSPLCVHDRISTSVTPKNLAIAQRAKAPDFTPIFIVGLPRSGTTLVERILGAHPMIETGEELHYLRGPTLKRLMAITGKPFPIGFQDLTRDQVEELAQEYTGRVRRLFPKAAYITDKNLGNFFAIGLVKILLPNAKVIALHRNPVATSFSILQNTFTDNMQYCCDLDKLAAYYRDYNAQMKHWHKTLPGFVLDIHYESLVKNLEAESRCLLKFCGLEWDEACLDFYKSDKAVRTLSAGQVTQPLYTSSVDGWKVYRNELAPLIKALGNLAI